MVALQTNSSSCFTRVGNHFFSDICDFSRTINIWHGLKATQLEVQPLESQYTVLDYGYAQFSFFDLSSPILFTRTVLKKQTTLGCGLQDHKANLIVQKNIISPEMLFGLNADQTLYVILQPGTVLCIFQISSNLFEKKFPQYDCQILLNQFSKTWYISSPEKPSKLRNYLANLYHQARQISIENRYKFESISDESIAEDFIRLLGDFVPLSSNADQKNRKLYLKEVRRAEIVYEAVAVLRANLHQQIRIEDLAKELNVSKRSLCYGFKEMFGIGPIKFLKIERLQRVRQALKEANPECRKVYSITEQFGIYSPGHFAKDYKQMFGETPSETLKRQP